MLEKGESMEEKEEIKEEIKEETGKIKKKKNKFAIIVIIVSFLCISACSYYLISSYLMVKKYDVDSFKFAGSELPTLNSALKSKKKLVVAYEEDNLITLKYDISKMKLNDVWDYLSKLSEFGFAIVNLEDFYMRTVNFEKDLQIRIKARSNHLVIEYNKGIDYNEPDGSSKATASE